MKYTECAPIIVVGNGDKDIKIGNASNGKTRTISKQELQQLIETVKQIKL